MNHKNARLNLEDNEENLVDRRIHRIGANGAFKELMKSCNWMNESMIVGVGWL